MGGLFPVRHVQVVMDVSCWPEMTCRRFAAVLQQQRNTSKLPSQRQAQLLLLEELQQQNFSRLLGGK